MTLPIHIMCFEKPETWFLNDIKLYLSNAAVSERLYFLHTKLTTKGIQGLC